MVAEHVYSCLVGQFLLLFHILAYGLTGQHSSPSLSIRHSRLAAVLTHDTASTCPTYSNIQSPFLPFLIPLISALVDVQLPLLLTRLSS